MKVEDDRECSGVNARHAPAAHEAVSIVSATSSS